MWVFFQLQDIKRCDTDQDILNTLQDLPKGLEETFTRYLSQIDGHSSKDRLKRLLRLVVCYEFIGFNDLVNLMNVDEMDDHWSQQRTINDLPTLVSRCCHLISTIEYGSGPPSFALVHFSVYDFLTSNPQSFEGVIKTLPQYHCYPLFDAYMTVARTLGHSYHIIGGPELCGAAAFLIRQWHTRLDYLLPAADFLTTMFSAPLVEGMRPSLVFPNAIHVTFINCRLFSASDSYYILTSQTAAEFSRGPYILTDVFPQYSTREWIVDESLLVSTPLTINVQPDFPAGANPVEDTLSDGTHIILEGFDFINSRNNNWIIHPSIGIIRNKTTTMGVFENRSVLIKNCTMEECGVSWTSFE